MTIKTDRELLELAAKAAGLAWEWNSCSHFGIQHIPSGLSHYVEWRPLSDDGDALRLAVHIGVFDGPASFSKFYSWLADAMVVEDDQAKAFRRAITCYAAEIARNMP